MDLNKFFIEKALYPAMEYKKGNKTREYTRSLIETQSLDPDKLEELRRDKLTELLLHCADNVPAYSALNKELIMQDPFAALRSIPVLKKADFNSKPEEFIAKNIPEELRIPNQTGGSTGVPTHFYMSRAQVEQYEAARWRGLSWYGISCGSRSVMIWGSHIELDKAAQKSYANKEKLLKNRMVIPAFELNATKADEYVKLLNSYKPEYLYGYASSLKAFAQIIDPAKLNIRLKAVVSTSETLDEEDKNFIASVFGCPVGNEYGARDAGILAYSCPKGHLHISAENAIIEILDPKTLEPLSPGQSGIVAVTDLGSRIQPRLRWLLGDMATIGESADCDITLPVFKSLDGRQDSMLVGANGRLIHGHMPNQIIRDYSQVRRFTFTQHTPQTATLLLEAEEDPALAEEIIAKLNNVEPSWKIDYKFTDKIELSSSGKLRASIREFDL